MTHLLLERPTVSSDCVTFDFPFEVGDAAGARFVEERVRREEVDDEAPAADSEAGAASAGAESGSAAVSCDERVDFERALDRVGRWSVSVEADDDGAG